MELIIFIVVVGLLFPSSAGSYGGDVAGALASIVAGVIVLGGLYLYWAYSMAGIMWLGGQWGWDSRVTMLLALFGPIAGPMLIASAIHAAIFYRMQRADRATVEPHP